MVEFEPDVALATEVILPVCSETTDSARPAVDVEIFWSSDRRYSVTGLRTVGGRLVPTAVVVATSLPVFWTIGETAALDDVAEELG